MSKKDIALKAWNNCEECECTDKDCPNNHRLCGICGETIMKSAFGDENSAFGWNVDHIIPKSKGGKNRNSNIVAVHIECNQRKGNNY